MRISAPSGTLDTLPEEVRMDRFVESVFMDKCRIFGYKEIHTPVFEYSSLFRKGVGHVTDIVEKELYTFSDKHGERLALRPEGTTSVTRALLQHGLSGSLPQKLCYKITCYRQEDPQEGRLREFHQIGAECYGSLEPRADCEVISLAYTSLEAMGVKGMTLNVNSLGCAECRVGYMNALARFLLPYANDGSLCPTCLSRLGKNPLRVLDCKNPGCKAVAAKAPKPIDFLCPECLSHYESVKEGLRGMGIPFNEKPGLIRGLDYYNRTVFEIKAGEGGANGTVCGGGRYDQLSRRIGGDKAVPAVGFAIGEERAVIAMRGSAGVPVTEPPQIYVIAEDAATAVRGVKLLRDAGIYAEQDLFGGSTEAQLERAAGTGAHWFAFAGADGITLRHRKGENEKSFGPDDWDKVIKTIK